ncbi:hypothetical protein [Streptomyces sp. NBC_01478]|uniref:hypothetical protein n=1 Tax=Streptomyces sp. NBC_01478 TaxID=2903882 RepID=UPI003FCDBEF1
MVGGAAVLLAGGATIVVATRRRRGSPAQPHAPSQTCRRAAREGHEDRVSRPPAVGSAATCRSTRRGS